MAEGGIDPTYANEIVDDNDDDDTSIPGSFDSDSGDQSLHDAAAQALREDELDKADNYERIPMTSSRRDSLDQLTRHITSTTEETNLDDLESSSRRLQAKERMLDIAQERIQVPFPKFEPRDHQKIKFNLRLKPGTIDDYEVTIQFIQKGVTPKTYVLIKPDLTINTAIFGEGYSTKNILTALSGGKDKPLVTLDQMLDFNDKVREKNRTELDRRNLQRAKELRKQIEQTTHDVIRTKQHEIDLQTLNRDQNSSQLNKELASTRSKLKAAQNRANELQKEQERNKLVYNEEVAKQAREQKEEISEVIRIRRDEGRDVGALIQQMEIVEEREANAQQEIEQIEQRMGLKERIMAVFKKYGFTISAILSAVGIVIGVLTSHLVEALGKVAHGLGNGLKEIGKKLGNILPGMIGAITSYIFKTAGQVIGFLGKHAWLLIMAVVLFAVEQLKNKRS